MQDLRQAPVGQAPQRDQGEEDQPLDPTSDFEEYQKFLEWKKEQKKRGTTRSPFLTNRSEKYERP